MNNSFFKDINEILERSNGVVSVAILGAGKTGKMVGDYLKTNLKCRICVWVDNVQKTTIDGFKVLPVEELTKCKFDYVIIASRRISYVSQMINQLLVYGISLSKMISVPLEVECYCNKPKNSRTIAILDPGIATYNLGDRIIMSSVEREMNYLFKDYFCTTYSTHLPIAKEGQLSNNFRNTFLRDPNFVKYTFCCGTDLLQTDMSINIPQWNVGFEEKQILRNVILLGVGSSSNDEKGFFNEYTAQLLNKILSKKYIHSVRNEHAVKMLAEIGINAINTGCPTLWGLTKTYCEMIPFKKSKDVIFTISEHKKDEEKDIKLIELLKKKYEKIYFWPQNYYDYNYLERKGLLEDIYVLKPNIAAYESLLREKEVDYVGTRLHGGIFAMQNRKRAIILSVDNRAAFMGQEFGLNVLPYGDWELLAKKIDSTFQTDIVIPEENINIFKKQFF